MNRKFIAVPNECILVTGSNGFIGSKVVEKLLDRRIEEAPHAGPQQSLFQLQKRAQELIGLDNVAFAVAFHPLVKPEQH